MSVRVDSKLACESFSSLAETLQLLTRDRLDRMNDQEAVARQRALAPLLKTLACTYLALQHAGVELDNPWRHAPTLSLLVHEVIEYLGAPRGHVWKVDEQDYWHYPCWQELLNAYPDSCPPESSLTFALVSSA